MRPARAGVQRRHDWARSIAGQLENRRRKREFRLLLHDRRQHGVQCRRPGPGNFEDLGRAHLQDDQWRSRIPTAVDLGLAGKVESCQTASQKQSRSGHVLGQGVAEIAAVFVHAAQGHLDRKSRCCGRLPGSRVAEVEESSCRARRKQVQGRQRPVWGLVKHRRFCWDGEFEHAW